MAQKSKRSGWMMVLYGLLLAAGITTLCLGLIQYANTNGGESMLLGLGVLAVIVPAALYPVAASLVERDPVAAADPQTLELLRSINERALISDTAKRLAYREQDREALRKAIKQDIESGDFEAGLVLVDQMAQVYGYRQESEVFRSQIMAARAAELDHKVTEALDVFQRLLQERKWDHASLEAAKIQRLYSESPRVRGLDRRVTEARERHKRELERAFLEAAQRDDIDKAMKLLKELDHYLTTEEAEPFLEVARGVIGKARQNLGVQFKMAVHDKEWTRALEVGQQIMQEFPNSKMGDEVRSMIDLLRERSAGEQAARPREVV